MKNSFHITLLFLFFMTPSYGQQENHQIKLEDLVQELVQQQEENMSYEDIYESLMQYYLEPLDINNVTKEQLQQLFILSPIQINNFIHYRNIAGPFLSIYELQSIPTFDESTIQKIIPFLKIKSTEDNIRNVFKNMFTNTNHYLLVRSGKKLQGEINEDNQGDANQFLIRYKNSKPGKFSYGLSLDKDEGEKNQWSPTKHYYGVDFISYHFTLFNKGKIKAFSIGDYQLQFGQGLILSSGFRLGKGSETILTVKKNNFGIKPYNSTLEYGFFRGATITVTSGLIEFTSFYSNKNIDGTLKSDSTFSPVNTGYHRSVSELNKRNSIKEQIAGCNLSLCNRSGNFHSGITFVNTHYNYILEKSLNPYNAFDYSGSNNYTTGTDISYNFHNFIFFGEAAISKSRGKGTVAGLLSNLSKDVEASMVYRNYERNFHSFYSNAFGENSENINEKGIYWGLKFKLTPRWILSCYYDRFSFPWLKFMVDAPSKGDEYLGNLSYRPNKNTLVSIQYRQENKEKNLKDNTSNLDQTINGIKRNYLFKLEMKASPELFIRTKIQMSSYKQSKSSYGYTIMNDFDLNLRYLVFTFRFALFDTDDFDNRQYVYEKDVLYSFAIPAYYGKGTRAYSIVKFKLFKNLDAWLRYSKTNYIEKPSAEQAGLPSKSDIRIQLMYTFQ